GDQENAAGAGYGIRREARAEVCESGAQQQQAVTIDHGAEYDQGERRARPRPPPRSSKPTLDNSLSLRDAGGQRPGKPRHAEIVFVLAIDPVHTETEACFLDETEAAVEMLGTQVARAHVQFDLADA